MYAATGSLSLFWGIICPGSGLLFFNHQSLRFLNPLPISFFVVKLKGSNPVFITNICELPVSTKG